MSLDGDLLGLLGGEAGVLAADVDVHFISRVEVAAAMIVCRTLAPITPIG